MPSAPTQAMVSRDERSPLSSGCCRSRRRAELTVLATLPSVGTRADGGGMTGIESTADSDAVNAGPTAIRLVHDGLSHISPFEQVSKPYPHYASVERQKRSMEIYVKEADHPIRRSPFRASTPARSLTGPTGEMSPKPSDV